MTALYIVGGVLLFIALLLLLPVKVYLVYGAEGFFMRVRLLCFTLVALPSAGKGEKKVKAEKKKKQEEKKSGGLFKDLLHMRGPIFEALGRLLHNLRVRELKVYYLAAAEDAYGAAMQFGLANAALGAVTAALENFFRVEKKDYRLDCSFEKKEAEIYIEARLSKQVWRILGTVARLLLALMKQGGAPAPQKTEEKASENVKGGLKNG